MSKPTVPTDLAASSVTSNAATLTWSQSRNPGTSLTTGPATGAWFGWDTDGDKQRLLSAEGTLGRRVDVYRADYRTTGRTKHSFPNHDDRVLYSGGKLSTGEMVSGGRIAVWSLTTLVNVGRNPETLGLLAGLTPAGSSSTYGGRGLNNVWTYEQISSGVLDDFWTAEFTRVARWGMPVWFVFEPEVDGNSRTVGAGGGGGDNPHLAAAGDFTGYVAAWAHLRDIADAATATNIVWVVSYGDGAKNLGVYQSAYPGDDQTDWISWAPANTPAPGGIWRATGDTLNLNSILSVKTPAISAGSSAKPIMLGGYGCGYDLNSAGRRSTWIDNLVTAASGTALKTLVYADAGPSRLNVQLYMSGTWSDTGTADTAAWASMKTQAAAAYFTQPHGEGGTGVGGYNVYVDSGGAPVAHTVGQTSTSVDIAGYTAGSIHSFQVTALDGSGPAEESDLSDALSVTFAAVEPVAPNAPSELVATSVTDRQINLHWDLPVDNGGGVGGYRIYVDGVVVATVRPSTVTRYAVSGLEPATSYDFNVAAADTSLAAWSAPGMTVTAETRVALDTTPPEPPAGLNAATVVSADSNSPMVVLTWSPSDGSDGTVGYNIYRNNILVGQIGRGDGRYEDTGLRPDTSYDYAVAAYDWAKNESVAAVFTIRTPLPSATAPLAVLAVTPMTGVAPLTVNADASASTDPTNRPLVYEFSFGDVPAAASSSFSSATNTYVSPGDYKITVKVTNDVQLTDSISVPISVVAAESRTDELNLYLPKAGDHVVGAASKIFWDQIRAGLRTLDQAVYDLRHP